MTSAQAWPSGIPASGEDDARLRCGPRRGRPPEEFDGRRQELRPPRDGSRLAAAHGGAETDHVGDVRRPSPKATGVADSVAATVPVKSHCQRRVDSLWWPRGASLGRGRSRSDPGRAPRLAPPSCPIASRPALSAPRARAPRPRQRGPSAPCTDTRSPARDARRSASRTPGGTLEPGSGPTAE